MDESTLRRKVQRKSKIRGYSIKLDALAEIVSFASRFDGCEDDAIDLVLDHLHDESLQSSIIDKDAVHRVVSILLAADEAGEECPDTSTSTSALCIIDAFDISKYRYDPIKKIFYMHTGSLPIHGDASAKAALYRDRFLLLSQRLSRDQHFSKPAFDSGMSHFGSCEISPVQSLVGQTGRKWVMGVISQMEDGHFFLEDLTASVEINLSSAKITTGLFTENTIVVAEGEMLVEGIFKVITCGFPPLEDRDKSLKLLAGQDFFGGGSLTKEETLRLADLEKRAVNDMFVILSDIWLDSEEAMGKLETILDGFENVEIVPSLFVLMGNFCSRPCNLAFNSYSSLRVRFYTQEIVFFRQDLLYRMRRSCLIPPSTEETSDPFEHLVATITHQSHLCPLPLVIQPIIWNYDHCLHLYPTPHVIVLGDRSKQQAFKYTGITCFNPGSFTNDSTFVAYRPCNQEVELSAL
ncbi:DNA polymerase epsilon subunit B, partial [Cucurbita argyrosperma subsp. sororia]